MTSLSTLDRPVILLSHRGPVHFTRDRAGERVASRGAGGLVSALSGLAGRLDDAVWVCAATSDEDRAVLAEAGGRAARVELSASPRVLPPGAQPAGPVIDLRYVVTDAAAHEQFYSVVANPLLWFVQHGLYGLAEAPDLTAEVHSAISEGYLPVNEAFAAAVVEEVQAHGGRALVMLHDYHFYLVAERVRQSCPGAVLTHFVHIPWPGPDSWRVLPPPFREQLIRGLLGNDVVAFHTKRFARNFLLCAQELLDLTVDLRRMTVRVGDREVAARHYPISIDVDALAELAASPEVTGHMAEIEERYLSGGRRLVLRVDRTDPSKNIVRGFKAFDGLLRHHPELAGEVTFLAMLQPSRMDVPEYADYVASVGATAADVNARHGRHGPQGWQPIELRMEEDLAYAVAAYASCDVLVVNAVNDGMNLVAKEAVIVNRRDGVLALSENTGAHEELGDYAVTLWPFDIEQQAAALYEALTMPAEDRRSRLAAAARVVRGNTVEHWILAQLDDLADRLGG